MVEEQNQHFSNLMAPPYRLPRNVSGRNTRLGATSTWSRLQAKTRAEEERRTLAERSRNAPVRAAGWERKANQGGRVYV